MKGSKSSKEAALAVRRLLAQKIKDYRAKLKWTQDDLGNQSGLGRAYIYRTESARNNLTIESLMAIAVALGQSVSELLSSDRPIESTQIGAELPKVGSHYPPTPCTLAIEIPVPNAFEIARIAARSLGYAVPLIDPKTREVAGIVAAPSRGDDVSNP